VVQNILKPGYSLGFKLHVLEHVKITLSGCESWGLWGDVMLGCVWWRNEFVSTQEFEGFAGMTIS
jgi:hypothetical protein